MWEVSVVQNLPVVTIIVIENPEGTMKIKFPLAYVPFFFENQYMKQYEVFNPTDWRLMLSKCNLKGFSFPLSKECF